MYKEIKGNLIKLALAGEFDVIAHGLKGDINKLGNIDYEYFTDKIDYIRKSNPNDLYTDDVLVIVVNAYIQYHYGKNHSDGVSKPLDYEALTLCMRKINHNFKGKHIGLPQIGCGLAGGDWEIVKEIIQTELIDCNGTVVIYDIIR